MSSRELLVLLDGLSDESLYKRAFDGYAYGVVDWAPSRYLLARIAAETATARGGPFDPTGLISPAEQAVSEMRERGEWPPRWWPQKARDAAQAADAQPERPDQVPVDTDLYDAAQDFMSDQIYGRS